MMFSLPKLTYNYNDLEPFINEETMIEHHTRHHQAYVDGINKLSESAPEAKGLHDMIGGLLKHWKSKNGRNKNGFSKNDAEILRKYGGGHYNHSLFWEYMAKPNKTGEISQFLMERIKKDFNSLDEFKSRFKESALKVFGSGWCWWVFDTKKGETFITITKDQHNPIMRNADLVCLLGLDVWEHAYYLMYKSGRKNYVDDWWNVVNWDVVSDIYEKIAVTGKRLAITADGYIDFDCPVSEQIKGI